MQENYKILVVDDDMRLRALLERYLTEQGFQVRSVANAEQMDRLLTRESFHLMVLDLMLPGEDGLSICRRLRSQSNPMPIIMVTAKGEEVDRIVGLEIGADDYIPKPFNPRELLARIRARFRIAKPAAEDGATGGASGGNANVNHLERGSIVIDRLEHTATKDGKDLNLTPMEFELLFMLAAAAGEAISRSSLLKNVWGYENSGDTRLVNVHVQRLRAKVEDDPENPQIVQTVRGIGYKFVTPEQ